MNNPRNGLRRWVIRSNHYSTDPRERVDWALVELHHDGSVALAISMAVFMRDAEILDETNGTALQVPFRVVDAVVTEAIALAATHIRGLGGVGMILTRATLLRGAGASNVPVMAIDNRLGGRALSSMFHRVPATRVLRNPVAVDAAFSAEDDVTALRGVVRQLADDLYQQFGMGSSSIPR